MPGGGLGVRGTLSAAAELAQPQVMLDSRRNASLAPAQQARPLAEWHPWVATVSHGSVLDSIV